MSTPRRTHVAAFVCGLSLLLAPAGVRSQAPAADARGLTFDRYHQPEEVAAALQSLARGRSDAAVHEVARTPGGLPVLALEIGPEVGAKSRKMPAVLVLANAEGVVPLASEGALWLAQHLVGKPDARKELTWYIVAAANPDGARHYFQKPLAADERNGTKINDDLDDQTDEDGPEDLNGDGLITQMRVKDPTGEWMAVAGDPRLMKRADPAKGERGVYRLYPEGLDNDGDGEYNEDPSGGVNVGITFPHLFKSFSPAAGLYPGSEPETFGLMKFVIDRPEIAMTMTFGSTNFCLSPPRGGRQGSADLTQIKIPERFAPRLGADPNRTYTMQEVMDLVRPMLPPGFDLNESMIASFLGLGAVVNPLEDDLKFYRELSDRYKEYLKSVKLDAKRLDPAPDKDGSFELWSYYHLGVPTFSLDFWTLPEPAGDKAEPSGITAETLAGMTSEAFLALGEAKIAAFLKEVGAPPNFSAKMIMAGVEGGKMTPKQMAGMLRQMPKPADTSGGDPKTRALLGFSDEHLQGRGFVAWSAFTHPTLGDVDVGGAAPYADTTPPPAMIAALLEGQVPWVLQLAGRLPRLKIVRTEAAARGGGVYAVSVWVGNTGYLPFPTAMGKRNQRVPPAVLTVTGPGVTFLSGRTRTPIHEVAGNGATKLEFLLRVQEPAALDLRLESPTVWNDAATVKLGGAR